MLPVLRTKLRGVSSKNKSLQDVIKTCEDAIQVLDVAEHVAGIHNTMITFLLKNGEKRVQFYNRIDIADILPESFEYTGDINLDINQLNLTGFDFTSDDLEYLDGRLIAKVESIGYTGQGLAVTRPKLNIEPFVGLMVTETGQLNYSLDPVGPEVNLVWTVDSPNKLTINPNTGFITAIAAGIVTVTLTLNNSITASIGIEIAPYTSIVAPTDFTIIRA